MEETNTTIPDTQREKILLKEYELQLGNEKYKISLCVNKSKEISITAENKNTALSYYKKNFSLQQLKELDKCFIFYDSLESILQFLQDLFEQKKSSLSYESNTIILNFSTFLPSGKTNDIKFILDKEIFYKNEITEKLYNKINKLEECINILINNDKKKDSIILSLEQRIEKREKRFEEKSFKDIKESSITNEKEIDFIVKELQNHELFKNKKIYFELMYKANKDNYSINDLHSKCDFRGQCIIFLKNTNGQRFGGYTNIGFTSENVEKLDNDAFVFSLILQKIFKISSGEPAIYCEQSLIGFKNTIYIRNDLFNDSNISSGENYNMKGYEFCKGYEKTNITNIELYHINEI